MQRKATHSFLRAYLRDRRGAVYVEFLIAFLPFLIFFLGIWQVGLIFGFRLIVDHAAVSAARAAAVVMAEKPQSSFNDEPPNELGPKRRELVRNAALIVLAPLILNGSVTKVEVVFADASKPGGEERKEKKLHPMSPNTVEMLRVRVEAEMVCSVPIVNVIACPNPIFKFGVSKFLRPTVRARAEALYPYQGAAYVYKQ
ncbi:MAG: hypothetical protein NVS3B20_25710 [Polyangiales bacterium]